MIVFKAVKLGDIGQGSSLHVPNQRQITRNIGALPIPTTIPRVVLWIYGFQGVAIPRRRGLRLLSSRQHPWASSGNYSSRPSVPSDCVIEMKCIGAQARYK